MPAAASRASWWCRRTARPCSPTLAIAASSTASARRTSCTARIKDKQPNTPASIADNVAQLKLLTAEGKPVFAVEYLDSPQEIASARKRLLAYGFIPHFADRELDHLRIGDLPDPGRKPGKK